jgi:hypothetical protein
MSFVGKKFVKVFNSLQIALAFTYVLHLIMNFEIPAKASWTWEIIQRLFASYESENDAHHAHTFDKMLYSIE